MQKIIRNYAEGGFRESFRNLYTKWKFGKPKHTYYVKNRRSNVVVLDQYDQYIIERLQHGNTIVYDAAGYYLADVIPNLTVVELNPIVRTWFPAAIIDTGPTSVEHLYGSAANFIVNNTIKLRWKTFDEFTSYWEHQTRFFSDTTEIFFSFRDIFVFHNRLKYRFSDLLSRWLTEDMEPRGFQLVQLDHQLVPVDSSVTELERAVEVTDMINGNVKIHWRYHR